MKKTILGLIAVLAMTGLGFAYNPMDVLWCNDGDITHGCKVETFFVSLTDKGFSSAQLRCSVGPVNTLCSVVTVYFSN